MLYAFIKIYFISNGEQQSKTYNHEIESLKDYYLWSI